MMNVVGMPEMPPNARLCVEVEQIYEECLAECLEKRSTGRRR